MEHAVVHLTFQTLIDYLEHTLDLGIQEEVQHHLDSCQLCQQELESARRTLLGLHAPDLTPAPPSLLRRALAAFRRRQLRGVAETLLITQPNFDNFTNRLAMGVRGAQQERQLLYSFKTFDLDLQISHSEQDNAMLLRGQLLSATPLPAGLEGITVQLIGADNLVLSRLTDELGRFSFSTVAPNAYRLQIKLQDYTVVIENLAVSGE
jgi:hypothetical protein